jgi:hypothetical protein
LNCATRFVAVGGNASRAQRPPASTPRRLQILASVSKGARHPHKLV